MKDARKETEPQRYMQGSGGTPSCRKALWNKALWGSPMAITPILLVWRIVLLHVFSIFGEKPCHVFLPVQNSPKLI